MSSLPEALRISQKRVAASFSTAIFMAFTTFSAADWAYTKLEVSITFDDVMDLVSATRLLAHLSQWLSVSLKGSGRSMMRSVSDHLVLRRMSAALKA
jgi:hypothetical protein